MRKVISGLFISLDGVVESPDQWQFDVFDADMGAAMTAFLASVDTILLGRVTYLEWANYWPTSDDQEYGAHINNTPKYVVSTTLDKVGWGKYEKPTLIKGNLPQEIARLKQQSGKSISTAGSPTLVRNLLQMNLLDELTLMIHPVVVGSGKKLFTDWLDLKRLKLVDSTITGSGVAFLTYHPA
jgi:dihydrofolate reductase